jgi:hypothetical protein
VFKLFKYICSELKTNNMSEEEKVPTPEAMAAFYKKQINLAKLRAELAKHHRDTAVYEFERLEATIKLDMMKNPDKYAEAMNPENSVEQLKTEE